MKFNAFLYHNEHPERIFLYLVGQFEVELSKLGTFLLNNLLQKWLKKQMLLMKVVLLI